MADHNREGESELESSTTSTTKKNVPLKVILIGKSGVGKSTLYLRIRDGQFYEDVHNQTLDYLDKTISLDNNRSVQMRLYDTANMEYHDRTVTRSYYHGSRVALILYSTNNMDSVDELTTYMHDVCYNAPNCKRFLVRNKIDIPIEDQYVQEDEVEAKLRKAGYSFDESNCKHSISAKEGEGIENLIQAIGQELKKQPTRHDPSRRSLKSYHKPKDNGGKSGKCC